MIPNINIDAVVSDPLLLIAISLLILGPLVFFVALAKFIRGGKPTASPRLSEMDSPITAPPYMEEMENEEPSEVHPDTAPSTEKTASTEPGRPPLPSITGEVQGQLEIVFSQIKMLSKKMAQLESEMETVSRTAAAKLEKNELKEVPMNPGDFTQKLLKLAEHVIVLEKEVARLKSEKNGHVAGAAPSTPGSDETVVLPPPPVAPSGPRPPIMPI